MKIVGGLLILAIGVLVGILSSQLYVEGVQVPAGSGIERSSPGDHVPEEGIQLFDHGVYIALDDPQWARFADTNSMDPVLDRGTNAIQIKPSSPDQIAVGDIITYERGENFIIHRVIEKGIDEDGVYFIVKGDNSINPDPGKVRFSQITRLTVALVY